MSKYRITEVDVVNDIHMLEKHVWWFMWKSVGFGSTKELEKIIAEKAKENA